MATLPPLTFQPLREDGNDNADEQGAVVTGRTLQKKLQRHGVAQVHPLGAKRKAGSAGIGDTTFLCVCLLFVAGSIAMALFLVLRD